MVDWQSTVFCRKVGFVEIYAFLVLIFFGQICISAIFITFSISADGGDEEAVRMVSNDGGQPERVDGSLQVEEVAIFLL